MSIKMMIDVNGKAYALMIPDVQYKKMKSPKEGDEVKIKWGKGFGNEKFIADAPKVG